MDSTRKGWPIAELARRVAAALAHDYESADSGRVRAVPDVRAIRWYASIGLLDKPAAFRGRTALYGPRHLRQLVAVKRLQAEGLPLADIQAELAGVSPQRLSRLAAVPEAVLAEDFDTSGQGEGSADDSSPPVADLAFWKNPPARLPAAGREYQSEMDDSIMSYGVSLSDTVTILIQAPHQPTGEDLAAIRAAAEPLLRAVDARGLNSRGVST